MLCAPDLLWPCRVHVIIPILLTGKLRPTKITMLAYHGYLVGEPGFEPAWLLAGPEPPPPSHGTSRGQGPGDQSEQGTPPQVVLTPKGGLSALLQSDCTGAGGTPTPSAQRVRQTQRGGHSSPVSQNLPGAGGGGSAGGGRCWSSSWEGWGGLGLSSGLGEFRAAGAEPGGGDAGAAELVTCVRTVWRLWWVFWGAWGRSARFTCMSRCAGCRRGRGQVEGRGSGLQAGRRARGEARGPMGSSSN